MKALVLIAALAASLPLKAEAQADEFGATFDGKRAELDRAEKSLNEALTRLAQALPPLESLAASYPLESDPRNLGPRREAARSEVKRFSDEAVVSGKDFNILRGVTDKVLFFSALGQTANDPATQMNQRQGFLDVQRREKLDQHSEDIRLRVRNALSADEAAWAKALDAFERRRSMARKAAMPGGVLLAGLVLLLAMRPRPKEPSPEAAAAPASSAQLLQGFNVLGPSAWAAGGSLFEAQAPDGRGILARRVDPALFLNPKEEQQVIAAGQAASRLSHQGLARVFGAFRRQGALFIALEKPAGNPLSAYLADGRRLQLRAVKTVISQAAAALDFAHSQGFVHLALHPGEFFVTDQGRTVLAELGVALPLRLLCARKNQPEAEAAAPYLAPELEAGDARPSGDVYALAAVAYRLLAGAPPFQGPAALSQKRAMAFAPLSKIVPAAGIDALFLRGLANEPARRYGKAGEFAAALSALPEPALPQA